MKIFHFIVLGAAILLPGAFVILFIALAKKYYSRHGKALKSFAYFQDKNGKLQTLHPS